MNLFFEFALKKKAFCVFFMKFLLPARKRFYSGGAIVIEVGTFDSRSVARFSVLPSAF